MTAVIQIKRSETAAAQPATLEYGELGINITDKKIYIGNSSGATTLLIDGSAPAGVSSFNTRTGAITLTSSDVTTALGFTPTTYTAPTLGSTTLTSGTTITSVAGLTSVTSTSFVGALTGNASTVTNGVYTTDTGTVTNTMLAGSIANNKLANSTISGVSLGSNLGTLTISTGLSGSSYNGSTGVTIAIDSSVVTETGTQTLSNKTISGSSNTLSNIANSSLTNSSITVNGSSISLGGSATVTANTTNALSFSTGLSAASSFNGSSAVSVSVDTNTIATRAYVDSVAQGLHTHSSVKAASQSKLATLIDTGTGLAYNSGIITWSNGHAATDNNFIDGHDALTASTTESLADKILIKNEGDSGGLGAAYNGTYYLYGARELRRTSDGDAASDWAGGDFCFVIGGDTYASTGWVQLYAVTTLGTDPISWSQFSGSGTYTADNSTINLSGGEFSIKTSYAGQLSITTLGTITAGTWNGTTIGTGYGGTGLTSFTSGGAVYATSTSALTTGTLPTTAGGVGLSSYTAGDMLYYASGTALSALAIGTNNYVLTSNGSAPVWTENTGTGSVVRATSPTLVTPVLGTPSSGTLSSCTGLPLTTGVTGTLGTTNGGTGLTSFTSGGLLYASSTSALTTGSVFKITSTANQNTISVDSTAIKSSQGFKVTAPLTHINAFGSYIDLSLGADDNGSLATYSQASLSLYSNSTYSYILLGSELTGNIQIVSPYSGLTAGTISSYLAVYDSNIGIIEVVDDATSPYVLFGADNTSTYVKSLFDTSGLELKALTFKLNTGTPGSGKLLVCSNVDGTAAWQTTISASNLPSLYIGTTAIQSSSANQAVTGISSITFADSTSMSTAPAGAQDYLLFALGVI
jgi:hypothetical protein